MYSNEGLNTKARSVKYEDLEYWLTDAGKAVRDGYSNYGHTITCTSLIYRKYPNLYAQEIGAGIDTETVKTTGLGISEEGTADGYTSASTSLIVTKTFWSGSMNEKNLGEGYNALKATNGYWIASRYASFASGPEAVFGLWSAGGYLIGGGDNIFNSKGGTDSVIYYHRLRPVVSLKSNIQIENCTGENGIDNMHKILF